MEVRRQGGSAAVRLVPALPRPVVDKLYQDHAAARAPLLSAWGVQVSLVAELRDALRAGEAIEREEATAVARLLARGACLNYRGKLESLQHGLRHEARSAFGELLCYEEESPAFGVVLSCLGEEDARERHNARAAAALEAIWVPDDAPSMALLMGLCT